MFERSLKLRAGQVAARLASAVEAHPAHSLRDAMAYAVAGGKGLRGFLVMESAALFDVPQPRALQAAAAVEALHAYSLVHDDLPCMDDDDLRRGMPTVHVKWDERSDGCGNMSGPGRGRWAPTRRARISTAWPRLRR